MGTHTAEEIVSGEVNVSTQKQGLPKAKNADLG